MIDLRFPTAWKRVMSVALADREERRRTRQVLTEGDGAALACGAAACHMQPARA